MRIALSRLPALGVTLAVVLSAVVLTTATPARAAGSCSSVAPVLGVPLVCTVGTGTLTAPAGALSADLVVLGGGGGGHSSPGGRGARVAGDVAVGVGDVLDVVVGAGGGRVNFGADVTQSRGNGGGWSGLSRAGTQLVVAGGGGGGTYPNTAVGGSAAAAGTAAGARGGNSFPAAAPGGEGAPGDGSGAVSSGSGSVGGASWASGGAGAGTSPSSGGGGGAGYGGGASGGVAGSGSSQRFAAGGAGGSFASTQVTGAVFSPAGGTSGVGSGGGTGGAGSVTVTFFGPAPTISTIAPSSGSSTGGTRVQVTGQDFTADVAVTIGGVPCPVVSATSTTVVCTSAGGPVGPRTVSLSSGGQTATTAYTYVDTQPGTPTAVTVLPGGSSLTVGWAAPTAGTVPVSYRVDAGSVTCTTASTSCVLTGATGTAYTVTVTATDAAGASGVPSPPVVAGPLVDPALPGSPSAADGVLTVAPAPLYTGAPVTLRGAGFAPGSTVTLGVYPGPSGLGTVVVDSSGALTRTVAAPAAGLRTFAAAGVTPSGAPRLLASAPGAVLELPGTPTGVSAVVGGSTVRVGWSAPPTGPAPASYLVTAQPGDRSCTTTGTSCVLAVTAGTTYEVTVVARDAAGTAGTASTGVLSAEVPVPALPANPPAGTADLGLSTTVLLAGARVTVEGSGFAPGSTVVLAVYSTPTPLGTVTTTERGTFSTVVTIPTGLLPGQHTVVALGVGPDGSAQVSRSPVTAPSPAPQGLASTGAAVGLPVTLAAVLLLAGGGALLAGRRRRR